MGASDRRLTTTGVILMGCLVWVSPHLVAQPASDERNPRAGTWRLNLSKSAFYDGPAPKSELQICEAAGTDGIHATILRVDARGKESRSEYTAHYDGKDYPFPGSPWDTIALKRVNRYTAEAVFKRGGNVVQTSTITVSKDGAMLTLRAKSTATPGQAIAHVEVFDKQ